MYRKAKRDANESYLVRYLRRLKCSVVFLDGPGIPDLAIGFGGYTFFAEVKNVDGKLTEPQKTFFDAWCGHAIIIRHTKDIKQFIREFTMPIRTYECSEHGKFDKLQKWSDAPLTVCPTCGKVLEEKKIYELAGIIYKGTGWYGTDSRVSKES